MINIATWEDLHNIRNAPTEDYTLLNDLTPDTVGYDQYVMLAGEDPANYPDFDPEATYEIGDKVKQDEHSFWIATDLTPDESGSGSTTTWQLAVGWEPIVDFSGNLDGGNFTISGLLVHNRDYAGLFANLKQTPFRWAFADRKEIKDLTITNSEVLGIISAGILTAISDFYKITNVKITESKVFAVQIAGGIYGEASVASGSASLVDCEVDGCLITSEYIAGGMVGFSLWRGVFENLNVKNTEVSLVYLANPTVYRRMNYLNNPSIIIELRQIAGGVFGQLYGEVLTNVHCDANCVVSGANGNGIIGGLVGVYKFTDDITLEYYPGLVNNIKFCSSAATVSSGYVAGGLVGMLNNLFWRNSPDASTIMTVLSCWSTGVVTGEMVGGLLGVCNKNINVISCYSRSYVNGSAYVGGLIGILTDQFGGDIGVISEATPQGSLTIAIATTNIINCYTANQHPDESGSGVLAGIVGEITGGLIGRSFVSCRVNSSVWDAEITGINKAIGQGGLLYNNSYARTTAQMVYNYDGEVVTVQYPGWSFTSGPYGDWTHDELSDQNDGYPYITVPEGLTWLFAVNMQVPMSDVAAPMPARLVTNANMNIYPTWETGISYVQDTVIVYAGRLFIATRETHPFLDPLDWFILYEVLGYEEWYQSWVEYYKYWDATTTYAANTVVIYGNKQWEATTTSTNSVPSDNNADWISLGESGVPAAKEVELLTLSSGQALTPGENNTSLALMACLDGTNRSLPVLVSIIYTVGTQIPVYLSDLLKTYNGLSQYPTARAITFGYNLPSPLVPDEDLLWFATSTNLSETIVRGEYWNNAVIPKQAGWEAGLLVGSAETPDTVVIPGLGLYIPSQLGSTYQAGASMETTGSPGTSPFSASIWFKSTEPNSHYAYAEPGSYLTTPLFSHWCAGGWGWSIALYQQTGRIHVCIFEELSNIEILCDDTTDLVSDGEWHHVAITRSGTNIKIYIDGSLADTRTSATTMNLDFLHIYRRFSIGSCYAVNIDPTKNFKGYLDDGRYYLGRALTLEEIVSIYEWERGHHLEYVPPEVMVQFNYLFNGSLLHAINAGVYNVVVTVVDPEYYGSAQDTFTIEPASVTYEILNNKVSVNDIPKLPVVASVPPNIAWQLLFTELGFPPTEEGNYAAKVYPANSNYEGETEFTMVVQSVIQAFNPRIMKLYERLPVIIPRDDVLIDHVAEYRYHLIEDYTTVGALREDGTLEIFDQENRLFVIQSNVDLFKLTELAITLPEAVDPVVDSLMDPFVINVVDRYGVPCIGPYTPIVYMNGHALVQNVDFTVVIQYEDGDWVNSQIVIQCMEYLTPSDNIVEIYISKDNGSLFSPTRGFSEPEIPFGIKDTATTFNRLSVYRTYGFTQTTEYIPTWGPDLNFGPSEHAPVVGKLCGIRTIVPSLLYEYLTNHASSSTDLIRIATLKEYYAQLPSMQIDRILIPNSHRLYSVFVHTILRDAINDALRLDTLHYDDIDVRLIHNYISGGAFTDELMVAGTPYSTDRAGEFRNKITAIIYVLDIDKSHNGVTYHSIDVKLLDNYLHGGLTSDEIMVQGTAHAPSRAAEFRSYIRVHSHLFDIDSTFIAPDTSLPEDYNITMLDAIVAPYLWLLDIDVLFREDTPQDMRFVDARPSYQILQATLPVHRLGVDLEHRYLDDDSITNGRLRVNTKQLF